MIQQGDLFWLQLENSEEQESRIPHPHVVINDDGDTLTVCALTTNLKRVSMPGNVLLDVGEGNLPKHSVVVVSKVVVVDNTRLGEYIGALSPQRMEQIFAGIRFVGRSYLPAGTAE